MATIDVQLKNSGINSGTAVNIFCEEFKIAWKNLTDTKPIPGAFDIAEVDFSGYEGPIITLKCVLDSVNLSSYLTYQQLIDFITRRTGTTTLKFKDNLNGIGGRPTAGYSSIATNTLDTTNGFDVQIKTFDITGRKRDDDGEEKLSCNIVLTETA